MMFLCRWTQLGGRVWRMDVPVFTRITATDPPQKHDIGAGMMQGRDRTWGYATIHTALFYSFFVLLFFFFAILFQNN